MSTVKGDTRDRQAARHDEVPGHHAQADAVARTRSSGTGPSRSATATLEYRTNGALVMFDMAGNELGRWTFNNVWPSKWSASDLDVGTDDLMTEEITLAVEELEAGQVR